MSKKITKKIPKNQLKDSVDTLKISKKSLEYLHNNGYKTIEDIVDRQSELPSGCKGEVLAYLIFGVTTD